MYLKIYTPQTKGEKLSFKFTVALMFFVLFNIDIVCGVAAPWTVGISVGFSHLFRNIRVMCQLEESDADAEEKLCVILSRLPTTISKAAASSFRRSKPRRRNRPKACAKQYVCKQLIRQATINTFGITTTVCIVKVEFE